MQPAGDFLDAQFGIGQQLARQIEPDPYAPHGIRLVAQQPSRVKFDDPLGMDREASPVPVTIVFDEGRYKCWYTILPAKKPTSWPLHQFNQYVCYAESSDGLKWDKPKLRLFEYEGSLDNNIVMSPYKPWVRDIFCPGVFIDNHGDPAERYKMIYDGDTTAPLQPWVRWHDIAHTDSGWTGKLPVAFDFGQTKVRLTGITFVEDPANPQSWMRDAMLQYWDDATAAWVDGPWLVSDAQTHTHYLEKPIESTKFQFIGKDRFGWPLGNLRFGELVFHGNVVSESRADAR